MLTRAWLVLFSLALLPVGALLPVRALAAEDDFIIIEDDAAETPSAQVLDFLNKYGDLSIGGYQVFGSSISRTFANINAGLNAPFELGRPGRIVLDLGYTTQRLELKQELDDKGNNPDMLPETRTIKVKENLFEFYEAYVSYEPLPDVVVTAGRERPIWGQFDIFSPVNLLLPIEFQSKKFSINKANYRRPQDLISVTWFPHERVELRAYYFLSTRVDPLFEEALSKSDDVNELPVVSNAPDAARLPAGDGLTGNINDPHTREFARPQTDFEDYDGYAARALYYGDAFTAGFTWYNGRRGLTFDSLPRVFVYNEDLSRVTATDTDESTVRQVFTEERLVLPKANAYAFEIAVPYGRFTWKGELVYNETVGDLGEVNRETLLAGNDDMAKRAFYLWIVNQNGGKGYIEAEEIWLTLGFDADYELWNFGFSLISIQTILSSLGKDGEDLQGAAYPDREFSDEVGVNEIFPNAYGFYKFGPERDQRVGIAAGFLGPLLGVTAYYNGSYRDNFSWTVSVEFLAAVSDSFISDANDDGNNYELKDDLSSGLRVGLSYDF